MSRLRPFAAAVVVVLIVIASTLTFAARSAPALPAAPTAVAASAGGIGVRLLTAPSSERGDPRAALYVIDRLAPGSVSTREMQVSNATTANAHVTLYATAAAIVGDKFVGAPDGTNDDLSSWTTVSPAAVVVPAGGKVTVTVTIRLPSYAEHTEQYGVIWAQTEAKSSSGQSVIQASRVGIRMYVSIGPGGAPAPGFSITTLTAARSTSGLPEVVASVHNTGGRALDMSGTLQLSKGPGSLSAGPFPATLGVTLALDGTEPVDVVLDKQIPAGPWLAHIQLTSGLVTHTVSATITFPAVGRGKAVGTKGGGSTDWALPAAIGGFLLALLVVGLMLLGIRMRRLRARTP